MTLPPVLATTWVVIEYLIKIAALGTVPENRRPSSSTAWLLLIFLLPLVGLPLYLLIGSPWVHGTRRRQQHTVNEITLDYTRSMPDLPKGARPSTYLAGALRMNRRLTGLPCVSGEVVAGQWYSPVPHGRHSSAVTMTLPMLSERSLEIAHLNDDA